MLKRTTLLFALVSAFAPGVRADSDLADLSLEDLVKAEVTSVSRRSQSLADVPAAAFVITAEDIRRSGAQALPDVLRMAPGIQVAQIDSGRYAVTARSFNGRFANKLQVLVDGRSIYHPIFPGVLWELDSIPLEDIERIEIIRGAGAVMWGANAVNGVINIISKHARSGTGEALSVTGGSKGNGVLYARLGKALDETTDWKLSLQARQLDPSQQFKLRSDGGDSLSNAVLDFRLDRNLGADRSLTVWANASRSKTGDLWNAQPDLSVPGVLALTTLQLSQVLHSETLGARYRWLAESGVESSLQFNGTLSGIDIGGFIKEDRSTLDFDYQGRYAFGVHDLLWGFSHRSSFDDVTPTAPLLAIADPRSRQGRTGLFVHDDWTLVPERLKLGLGLRLDQASDNGRRVSPNATLLWTPSRSDSAWLKFAQAPRFTARAEQDVSVLAGVAILAPGIPLVTYARANPDGLVPEKSAGFELGYRKQVTSTFSVDVAAYHYRYTDLRTGTLAGLYDCSLGGVLPVGIHDPTRCLPFLANTMALQQDVRIANGLTARNSGVELSTDWLVTPTWRLQFSYSLSWLKTGDSSDPSIAADAEITRRGAPRQTGSLRSQWNISSSQQLDLWLRGSSGFYRNDITDLTPTATGATSFVRVPGYATLDLRYGYRVNRELELALVGRNLIGPRRFEYLSDYVPTVATEVSPTWAITARWKF